MTAVCLQFDLDDSLYNVTLTSYIANGGDGNDIIKNEKLVHLPGSVRPISKNVKYD